MHSHTCKHARTHKQKDSNNNDNDVANQNQVKEVLERVDADQRLLIQFAEEKVQLALRGYDVLDRHLSGLETDAAALTEELQANARLADALGEGAFGGGATPAFDELGPGGTGRTARLRDLSSFDSLDAAGSEFRPGRRSALAISRQPSEEGLAYDGATPGPPARRPPSAAGRESSDGRGGGWLCAGDWTRDDRSAGGDPLENAENQPPSRRMPDDRSPVLDPAKCAGRTPQASAIGGVEVGSAGGSHIPKRRAASAAVHAAAAAVAAMDEDEGADPAAGGAVGGGAAFATPLLPGFDHAAEQPQVGWVCTIREGSCAQRSRCGLCSRGEWRRVLAPGRACPLARPFFPPRPRAPVRPFPLPARGLLSPSSPLPQPLPPPPQAPGRLLTTTDIGPGLVGRRAELYWPDNNLWYLIEVRGVDLAARTASILYTTGEVEELDLDEIVKEGHLSLITSLRSTRG